MSGCFCSDGTVLKDGVCSNASYCSGTSSYVNSTYSITLYITQKFVEENVYSSYNEHIIFSTLHSTVS